MTYLELILYLQAEMAALAQPEQEPTPWRDMVVATLVREGIDKHRARELADHFAAQLKQEPVAFYHPRNGFYWAKPTSIFAPTSVDVEPLPLYTQPSAAAHTSADTKNTPPPEWEAIDNILGEYGLQAIDFVADWKATLRQAEPVAWGVFEGNLHDMFFSQEEAQEMAQLKGTHAEVRPLYTTSPAAQRPWQGLTDDEQREIYKKYEMDGWGLFYDAIEAALRSKNT
jgi:hypothetical protein